MSRTRTEMKGQYQILDMLLGLTIFMVLLTLTILMYSDTYTRLDTTNLYWRMLETNRNVANQLMLSGGEPAGWDWLGTPTDTNIQAVGLADEPNVLNAHKVDQLRQWNASYYTTLRSHMGSPFETYLELRYASNGSVFVLNNSNVTFGSPPNETVFRASSIRMGWLNGTRVLVNLTVWRPYGSG